MLNCCSGSQGSTDGRLGCQEECELYPSFVLECILVACIEQIFSTRPFACVRARLSTVVSVNRGVESVRVGPTMPAPEEAPPDTQALPQPGHAGSASRFRLVTGPLSLGRVRTSDMMRAG